MLNVNVDANNVDEIKKCCWDEIKLPRRNSFDRYEDRGNVDELNSSWWVKFTSWNNDWSLGQYTLHVVLFTWVPHEVDSTIMELPASKYMWARIIMKEPLSCVHIQGTFSITVNLITLIISLSGTTHTYLQFLNYTILNWESILDLQCSVRSAWGSALYVQRKGEEGREEGGGEKGNMHTHTHTSEHTHTHTHVRTHTLHHQIWSLPLFQWGFPW